MKLKQQYPSDIRFLLDRTQKEIDQVNEAETGFMLQQSIYEILITQQALIKHLLEHVYHDVEVPTEPVGIWAPNYDFDEWLRIMETSIYHIFPCENPILADMKKGEIVILRDPSYIECAGISSSMYKHDDRGIDVSINVSAPNHFRRQYKHDDKRIYVCIQDSPTSPNHFRQFDGTIDEHIQIIDNFLKTTGA